MSGESMAHEIVSKVRLKFLHQKNKYPTPNLHCLLYLTSVQCHFYYACSAQKPNLSRKI